MSAPQEIVTACIYWVLSKADGAPLAEEEILGRVKAMTPDQIREARAEHARSIA